MKMSKVGNQTNSQDPQAINSRVFVGNLNTFQCIKTDVERMFQRYGRIAGISMHKGYAFIQFTNPFDARSACLGEDGRTVLGQTLDVNMVAEPKPHQTGRKRQNLSKTGNDWDYYYDSYYASASFAPGPPRWVPPLKRARLMVPPGPPAGPPAGALGGPATSPTSTGGQTVTRSLLTPKSSSPLQQKSQSPALAQLKTYSTPDILICGNCREMFSELHELMDHKKTYCKLRFTCKCHILNGINKPKSPGEEPAALLCVQCKDSFNSAWDLMVHVQAAHMLNIYELGMTKLYKDEDKTESETEVDGILCPSSSASSNGSASEILGVTDDGGGEITTLGLGPLSSLHLVNNNNTVLDDNDKDKDEEVIINENGIPDDASKELNKAIQMSSDEVPITNGDLHTLAGAQS